MSPINPEKILVIAMPYLGDVLLATPFFHSLRLAYPNAQLDVLVFEQTDAMLEGNPDINYIITTPRRPTFLQKWALFFRIFRRYDLAMAIQTNDRPFFYTLFASSFRINAVPPKPVKGWWKRFFATRRVEFDNDNTHTVLQNLKLLDLIQQPKHYDLIPPRLKETQALETRFPWVTDTKPYAVLHALPQWHYKRWTREGWLETGDYLHRLGYRIVLSGGPGAEETAYLKQLSTHLPDDTVNIAGKVSLAELTHIISRSTLFIGPDTGITHLAAATGVPVIALFGPTNPVKWAPWPYAYRKDDNPFAKIGNQHAGNITLLQGQTDCVPCHLSGCENHNLSHSRCLDELPSAWVKAAIDKALNDSG